MYAVVISGGKQYRVAEGDTLVVDRIEADAGASVTLPEVLMVGGTDAIRVGTPMIDGASVEATVVEQGRGKKTEYVRYLHRQRRRTTKNGRAYLTVLKIDRIQA